MTTIDPAVDSSVDWHSGPRHTCHPGRLFAAALRGGAIALIDGERTRPLTVLRWNTTDESDRFLIAACDGATLDVGCGPGRMTAGLADNGGIALGIDVVPEAVRQTRARGADALLLDVFDEVPGSGQWQTVLLADGNIGIGGDPERLLRRVRELLAPDGTVVVDLAAPGRRTRTHVHRLEGEGMVSHPFPWATVGTDQIEALAAATGLRVVRTEEYDGRWFAVLEKDLAAA